MTGREGPTYWKYTRLQGEFISTSWQKKRMTEMNKTNSSTQNTGRKLIPFEKSTDCTVLACHVPWMLNKKDNDRYSQMGHAIS